LLPEVCKKFIQFILVDNKLLGDMHDFVPTAFLTSAISDKGNGLIRKHDSGI